MSPLTVERALWIGALALACVGFAGVLEWGIRGWLRRRRARGE